MFKIVEHWAQKQDNGEIDWFTNPLPHCVACKWQCPFTDDISELRFMRNVQLNASIERIHDSINTFRDKWENSGLYLDKAHLCDHALGGDSSPDNLVPLCRKCHQSMSRTMFECKEEAIRWIKNTPLCHSCFQEYTDVCFCEKNDNCERMFRKRNPRFISEYERLHSIMQKNKNWKLVWKSPEGDYIDSINDMEIYEYGKNVEFRLSKGKEEGDGSIFATIECLVQCALEDLEESDTSSFTVKRYKKVLKAISENQDYLNIPTEIDCLDDKELLYAFNKIEDQLMSGPPPLATKEAQRQE